MKTESFSLDRLGPVVIEIHDHIVQMQTDIGAIKRHVDQQRDQLSVVSGLAIRATGERVAWASVQGQLRKLTARIEALERRGG